MTARVNLVVKRGWILERLARELEGEAGVTINRGLEAREVDKEARLNYYLPAKDVLKFPAPPGGRTLGLFTHGDPSLEVLSRLSAATAMNRRMGARLRDLGAADVTVVLPGTEAPTRPPVFGVVGRAYNNGRKGEGLVRLAVASGFRFVACAPREKTRATARARWPCRVTHPVEEREAFYRSIDYLVVTSIEEGGPMPVLEAIARHVPVIAPDVGFCWELPVIRYEVGSWGSLEAVLARLSRPPTWQDWTAAHRALFARLAA